MADQWRRRVVERLRDSRTQGLYPYDQAFERAQPPEVLLDGQPYLMASSYDYLSLIGHPRIEAAACEAVRRNGTATGGVRLLTGTTPGHRALERRIAERYGTEDCVTFSSGYFANIAAMAAFGGCDVTAFVDALSHRSVLDACKLAGSPVSRFRHNDPCDLKRLVQSAPASRAIIFVESLYSMDGDGARLGEIDAISRAAGVSLLIDDAHGLGVLDPPQPGRGVCPAAWVGSLSKAVPSNGGFVATSQDAADRVRHMAAPYIFSAAASPASVAAAHAALDVIDDEGWRRKNLRANIASFARLLFGKTPLHDPQSPIFPIRCGNDEQALRAAADLKAKKIIVTPIVAPAVGPKGARLRICINAAHRAEHLERLAEAVRVALPVPCP